jgi:hypothetical protein
LFLTLLLFAYSSLGPSSTWAKDLNPYAQCDFYPDASSRLSCDSREYLQQFGDRYCRLFVRAQPSFSPAGQKFLAKIRSCLIADLSQKMDLSCENVRDAAERSHMHCYLKYDFCDQSADDKMRILKVMWPELIHPSFRGVIKEIQSECRKRKKTRS